MLLHPNNYYPDVRISWAYDGVWEIETGLDYRLFSGRCQIFRCRFSWMELEYAEPEYAERTKEGYVSWIYRSLIHCKKLIGQLMVESGKNKSD